MTRPEGIGWADSSKRSLADKVRAGAASFERRRKRKPNTCWLCPETVNGDGADEIDGIRLVLTGDMPPFHFWFSVVENGHGPTEPAPEPEPEPPRPPVVRWGCSARCGDVTAWAVRLDWCPSCGAKLERIEL